MKFTEQTKKKGKYKKVKTLKAKATSFTNKKLKARKLTSSK